jgi:Spy/CpxP family protein refolding chaperone
MKTHTKALIGAGVIAAATVGSFFAYLAHAETNDVATVDRPFKHRWAALGLSDDQKAQVKSILQKYKPTTQPLVQQLVTERRALRDVIQSPTIDESAIRAEAAKVASLQADLAVQRAHVSHDIQAVLTPDQIQKLQEMKAKADARFDGFRHHVAKSLGDD